MKKSIKERQILDAACETFLHYGYHGTRIQQIANVADVNQSIIHYYFRSKTKLYTKALIQIVENILNIQSINKDGQYDFRHEKWFFETEQYNNISLFKASLQDHYGSDWEHQLKRITQTLEQLNSF